MDEETKVMPAVANDDLPVAEAVGAEAAQNGDGPSLPMGTVDQILENAPKDLETRVIDVPEWGCSVKLKSLTAAERAKIRQVGLRPGDPEAAWGEMEVQQFLHAVVEPRFTEHQVRKLHQTSGRGFARVIDAHDDLATMSKEDLRTAQNEFQGPK